MHVIFFCVLSTLTHACFLMYSRGYFDRFRMSESRFKQWEDTILANFARREGWVAGHAATGSDAWNNSSVRLHL